MTRVEIWLSNLYRSLLAGIFGLIVVASVFEGGCRIAHALVSKPDEILSVLPKDWYNTTTIRVIVLGESTSGPFSLIGRDISWPPMLERELISRFSKRGFTFRVLNLARASSSSPFQVARFERVAKFARPDILISMLGVNDGYVRAVEGNFFYNNFYFVRFLYWADVAWSCPRCHDLNLEDAREVDISAHAPHSAGEVVEQLLKTPFRSQADIENFRTWRVAHEASEGDAKHYVNAIVAERLYAISELPRLKKTDLGRAVLLEAKRTLDQSYREMVLTRGSSLEHYCHIRARLKQDGCAEALRDAVQAGFVLTPQTLTMAAHHGGFDDEVLRKLSRSSGYDLVDRSHDGEILAESYERLEDIVREQDIVWMPMQYPTGSVGALEFYLSNDAFRRPLRFRESFSLAPGSSRPRLKNAIYISNENFGARVNRENESEYYIDYFARTQELNFGHTTEKGSKLIATNAADQIETSWPEIEPRLKGRRP